MSCTGQTEIMVVSVTFHHSGHRTYQFSFVPELAMDPRFRFERFPHKFSGAFDRTQGRQSAADQNVIQIS
jgi:hypothetical protein